MIKEFVISQKDLWQQVPYWALQANGKLGFSENFQTAYLRKAWIVFSSDRNGIYTLAIDCVSGELIWPWGIGKDTNRDIPDDDVIVASLEHIDATKVIEELQKMAAGPDLPKERYGVTYNSGAHWREVLIQENSVHVPQVAVR